MVSDEMPGTLLLVEDDVHFAAWAISELSAECPDLRPVHAPDLGRARAWLDRADSAGLRLAVVDLHLGQDRGVDLIAELSARRPDVPILVLTSVDTPEEALLAIRAGAQGYLLKVALHGELGRAVRQMLAGGAPINPGIAHLLLKTFRAQPSASRPSEPERPRMPGAMSSDLFSTLSTREAEVLQLIARGFSDKEAANRLGIAPSTVDTHVRSIYRKFGVHSRAQLRGLIGV